MTVKTCPDISLVVPVYNEAETIELFFNSVLPHLESVSSNYEIVCIDDGSRDDSWNRLCAHAEKNPRIRLLSLSRNFGKEIALSAGLDHTTGRTVVPLDCDLQDPPELIPEMYKKWQQGFDVVLAQRSDRDTDTRLKRWTAKGFYELMHKMSDIPIPQNVGDFRLMDRKVLEILEQYPERTRFMKGIFASVGFKSTTVQYSRPKRSAGSAKQNYLKLYKLAVDGIVSFTSIPLKLWSFLGVTIASFSLLFGIYLIVKTLVLGIDVPGYASIMVVQLFMSGLILLSLGVIGEYISRIFTEVKARPLYIVMDKVGFESKGKSVRKQPLHTEVEN